MFFACFWRWPFVGATWQARLRMSKRKSRHGLKAGSKVWVNIDESRADLLQDMGLVDETDKILDGLRM